MITDRQTIEAVESTHVARRVSSYVIGPIDPSELILMHAHCASGEECSLFVPASLPLWILNDPAFRQGYETCYESKQEGGDEPWGSVSHMVNQIYSYLLGEGFEDPLSGELAPDFGIWEIGWQLRDFTRLADSDRTLALTGIAHLCFLVSFLPSHPPACWPPASLRRARSRHYDAVKAYEAAIQGGSVLLAPVQALPTALLAHPDFQRGLCAARQFFPEVYLPAPLTEAEMIEEVELSLTAQALSDDKLFDDSQPYLYLLGRVIGTIDKGLSYATGEQAV